MADQGADTPSHGDCAPRYQSRASLTGDRWGDGASSDTYVGARGRCPFVLRRGFGHSPHVWMPGGAEDAAAASSA